MAPIDLTAALPTELVNLLALHSSFLTALSLHFVHNGTGSPIDLRDLTETTTSVWRHRKVTYDDIRLCVGVLGCGPAARNNPFHLSDYGRGKICLEVSEEYKMQAGLSQMNEEALKIMFMESLDHLWRQWSAAGQTAQKMSSRPIATPKKRGRGRPRKSDPTQSSIQSFIDEPSMTKFIAQLPHAEITTCESLTAIAPLQEKGRKRLREFKDSVQQGRAVKKTRESTGKENAPVHPNAQQPQTKMTDFTTVRKTNLLDRILAKEAAAASGPKALSPAELQRKAALQRSEDVLGVLSLLCASKGPGLRISLSMNALLQSLQSSIRTPISKEEALKCIEVLANEVTPGYVNVVRMGALSSVVVNMGMRPVDVKGRLVALGAY
ncbi:uncharacterized protein N0V89_001422 [Didymosphaeria variabile]|uniref:DNA replication factor Cdt1 C-terminal domain-containing protein n=1 Tax=Didymosphaeria variabile TaxID=1932322 RepID=A0A9W8XYD7_9PLEO|nr:uncharacterized protein N0V89_001422 [Didymosphaeria variabile]KAJ4360855.1 hypothetical protein N0V89_001422 [Didymosphaeria variabile]